MMLKEKKAIVTGGARGIGLEIVLSFLREGAAVYFIDLNPSESLGDMEAAAKEGGGAVVFKQANVAAEELASGTRQTSA
jgi:3-oxoacyl-[acyl-carrier protein] reductase